MTRRKQGGWLIGIALALLVCGLFLPRIPQPASYHNFADHRSWLGIPNFGDVVSNLPFALVGIWGLVALFTPGRINLTDSRECWPYVVMFASLVLTACGSGYYHLTPNNARLENEGCEHHHIWPAFA